ncbi:transposase [Kineothrix sedimenti]|uniref:Transposase n=1 Tax=Kineothrix sedimenti TaxID=3123317 RepID=A0ABZ3EWJ8_9FIRM
MAKKYTVDELNGLSKESMMVVILSMQEQLEQLNQNMERLIEQIAVANNQRYGRSSEKLEVMDGQLNLDFIFNEAEALTETLYVVEPAEDDVLPAKKKKQVGKRDKDLAGLPVVEIPHVLSEEELTEIFGVNGWKQLPDEVYKRVKVEPAVYTVEEHHVAVYAGRDNQTIVKADRL